MLYERFYLWSLFLPLFWIYLSRSEYDFVKLNKCREDWVLFWSVEACLLPPFYTHPESLSFLSPCMSLLLSRRPTCQNYFTFLFVQKRVNLVLYHYTSILWSYYRHHMNTHPEKYKRVAYRHHRCSLVRLTCLCLLALYYMSVIILSSSRQKNGPFNCLDGKLYS